MKDSLNISSLPSPIERYNLGDKVGSGIFGSVFKATDNQATGKAVAIKVQTFNDDTEVHIQEEYKILRDFTKHPNLVDFYGVFCERSEGVKKIWFVLEVTSANLILLKDLGIAGQTAINKFLLHASSKLGICYLCTVVFSVVRMRICHRYCQKTEHARQKNVRGTHRLRPQIYDQGKPIFD